jgi:hypothetical protein
MFLEIPLLRSDFKHHSLIVLLSGCGTPHVCSQLPAMMPLV